MLAWIIKSYHSDPFGGSENEDKRLYLIAPMVWSVAQLLPDVRVKLESNLPGERVRAHAQFEFVLERGSKRVCVLQVKEEKFKQGMIQNLVGCEVGILRLLIINVIVLLILTWVYLMLGYGGFG